MSVELGSLWVDNDSDLLVIVKSLEGNYDGKVKVVFNYIIRTGDKSVESASELDLFLKTKTKLVKSIEGDYSKGFKKGKEFNKDDQNLNYRIGYNDGWHDCEALSELDNKFTDSIQKQAYEEGYDQAIEDLIEAGVIGEEEYLDDDCSDEVCSEYEFGDVGDDEDGEEEYCFSKELDKILNAAFVLDTKSDGNTKEDLVSNPSHYNSDPSGVKCIEITRHRNNNIGNVIKYVWRNGLKDGNSDIQDLEKAAWYLNDEIQRLKGIE